MIAVRPSPFLTVYTIIALYVSLELMLLQRNVLHLQCSRSDFPSLFTCPWKVLPGHTLVCYNLYARACGPVR